MCWFTAAFLLSICCLSFSAILSFNVFFFFGAAVVTFLAAKMRNDSKKRDVKGNNNDYTNKKQKNGYSQSCKLVGLPMVVVVLLKVSRSNNYDWRYLDYLLVVFHLHHPSCPKCSAIEFNNECVILCWTRRDLVKDEVILTFTFLSSASSSSHSVLVIASGGSKSSSSMKDIKMLKLIMAIATMNDEYGSWMDGKITVSIL